MASPVEAVDCMVVGAGVVGLAVARAMAVRGREVIVCEREGAIGQGTTSRNSEVVHAGLYYTPGSLKARLCVQGREALYRYCDERRVDYRKCGKLIVASSRLQLSALAALQKRAMACGVDDVRLVSAEEAKDMEPEVVCHEALLSPSTGIVDSHGLTLALQGDAEANGAMVSLHTPVQAVEALADGQMLVSAGGTQLRCRSLINCAGLNAIALAGRVKGSKATSVPKPFFAKGNYFRYTGKPPFRRLVYPLPEPNQAGLGVHATIDLQSQVRFGPDVEWLPHQDWDAMRMDKDGFDYNVDPFRAAAFCDAIRRYWPAVEESKLVPDYSGIRPKLRGPEGSESEEPSSKEQGRKRGAADFIIQGGEEHGVPGLVNLFGIESPGLTASLAIADHVAQISQIETRSS